MVDPEIILKNKLVPKHEILPEKETQKLLEKYNLNSKMQLPKILSSDPVVKAIGAEKGDVIKITRSSITAGETVYYRVVL